MKNLLYLFLAVTAFSCSSDSNDTNDNNVPEGQYFFEIEFAGETHRIQGVNSELFTNSATNICSASIYNGDMIIQYRLNDITAYNYISGQPIYITMTIENPQLGNNNGRITLYPTSYMQNYAVQNNISIEFQVSNFVENSPNLPASEASGLLGEVSNISITNLGTPPSSPSILDGQNIKGSYQGTLYFRDDDDLDNGSSSQFSVAVPLTISFSAPRTQ